jgi:hypothetical protein
MLLVDRCPVVLMGWGRQEGGNLSLDLRLLSHEKLESLLIVLRTVCHDWEAFFGDVRSRVVVASRLVEQ